MTTKRYSPVGKGRQKFTCTVCHGLGGNSLIFSGTGWAVVQFAWQGIKITNQLFNILINSREPKFLSN